MTEALTHWERVQAAIEGGPTDHPPVSFWRHWPDHDQDADRLARATLDWQARFDFDLVKLTPAGVYGVADWGVESIDESDRNGVRKVTRLAVAGLDDWRRITALDPRHGHLGREVRAVRLVAEGLKGAAPLAETVFAPLTVARKLAGDLVFRHIAEAPERMTEVLGVITDTLIAFARATLAAGADGIFFATQCASSRVTSEAVYRRFGEPFDRRFLEAVRASARLIVLHVHGEDTFFDLVAQYPADMINWHDRITPPSLEDGARRFPGAIVGGVDEQGLLMRGPPADIALQVRDAIRRTGGRRLMVGAGCVLPPAVPERHLRAAIEAARRIG